MSSHDIFNEDLSLLLSPDDNTFETPGLRLKLPYSATNEPYSISFLTVPVLYLRTLLAKFHSKYEICKLSTLYNPVLTVIR